MGDRVSFSPREKVIEKIHPRRTCLLRPPVANVDQVVVVLSICNPPPDWFLATRLLVQVEQQGMEGIICITKIDLADAGDAGRDPAGGEGFPVPAPFYRQGEGEPGTESGPERPLLRLRRPLGGGQVDPAQFIATRF